MTSNGPLTDAPDDPTCFMAMPISTRPNDVARYDNDPDHWLHVMESLFVKALQRANYRPIRPAVEGSHMIHGEIIKNLASSNLVLVDLSSHNPNVFFELGVRTSLNLPIALVRDEHTSLPFDTSGINTFTYDSSLRGWNIERQQAELADHIVASSKSCNGNNPLWRHFGLSIKAAQEPSTGESPLEAKVDLLAGELQTMMKVISGKNHREFVSPHDSPKELAREVDSYLDRLRQEQNQWARFEESIERWNSDHPDTTIIYDSQTNDEVLVKISGQSAIGKSAAQRQVLKIAKSLGIQSTFIDGDSF